jgi:outer membrane protein assembly factor BamA
VIRILASLTLILLCAAALAQESTQDGDPDHRPLSSDLPVDAIPDLRENDTPLKYQDKKDRNFFVVPVPMSSPTFGTGLILGGAYFYPQTRQQEQSQPSSFTGAAAGYTTNDSWFAGVMHQGYLNEDRWRLNALAAYADFRLELIPGAEGNEQGGLDWIVRGTILQARLSRRIISNWYFGASVRYLDVQQDLTVSSDPPDFNAEDSIQSPGIGLSLEYDTRDVPSNPYTGRQFELRAVFADQNGSAAGSYQSYFAEYRSYHRLGDPLVLAWQVNGCAKEGRIPLWDTCRLTLRGFPVTEYLSARSLQAQAELRWRFHQRWGVVAFAGGGEVWQSLGGKGEDDVIPSYGVGLRWMVLPSERVNVRIDYARSDRGNDAWYLSVSEAF